MSKDDSSPFFPREQKIIMPESNKIVLPGSEPIPPGFFRGRPTMGYGATPRTEQLVVIGRHNAPPPPPAPRASYPEIYDLTADAAPVTQVPPAPSESSPTIPTPPPAAVIETITNAPVEAAPVEAAPVEPEVIEATVEPETINLSTAPLRNEGGATDNGYVSFEENYDHMIKRPAFAPIPDGAYVALVGEWGVNDAEMIKIGLQTRQIEAFVPNPDNWNPQSMEGFDKLIYVQELTDHEHDAIFLADAVLLDLRGPEHHRNDYLIGALCSSIQHVFVVLDPQRDNTVLRAQLDYFRRQKSEVEVCENIFDAVLQVADYMDTFQWSENFATLPNEAVNDNTVTRQVFMQETETHTPKQFTIGVGVLIRNESGQFLGFRKREGGQINLPFGFMHKDELPAQAASRILADEAGVIVSADDLTQVHVGWRGRRSGYVACFGVKSDAIIRRTTPAAPYVLETVWAEEDVLTSNEAYGDYNTEALKAYASAPVILATVMDLSGDLMNVSPTVALQQQATAAKNEAVGEA